MDDSEAEFRCEYDLQGIYEGIYIYIYRMRSRWLC